MHRPSKKAVEFSTKFIEQHLNELQSSVPNDDERIFDEVTPRLNVAPKRQVAKDLPKIEVKPLAAPPPVKRKPYPMTRKPMGPSIVDIEYTFKFTPVRLEALPPVIPDDYGYDYMTDQLLDLVFQFTRLSTPDVV
jgi:hypothetical protein